MFLLSCTSQLPHVAREKKVSIPGSSPPQPTSHPALLQKSSYIWHMLVFRPKSRNYSKFKSSVRSHLLTFPHPNTTKAPGMLTTFFPHTASSVSPLQKDHIKPVCYNTAHAASIALIIKHFSPIALQYLF